jgi:diguanylate cyclase (GGDEF)-like protein
VRCASRQAVLFVDLDHFKDVNDTYGRDVGDAVLKTVSAYLVQACRECDVVGRVGGEEFSVYFPETDHSGAMAIVEKVREKIESLMPLMDGKNLRITASIGVASNLAHHKAIADILRDADHAMYHAINAGRNRVSSLELPCYVEEGKPQPD